MPTNVDRTVPKFTDVTWSGVQGDRAQLAVRAEDGKVYGIEIALRALMPVIVSLLAAGRMMPEQGRDLESQAIQAEGFQSVIHPDGSKGIAIALGGALELVLNIPQEKFAALRAAIAELEAIPTPKSKN